MRGRRERHEVTFFGKRKLEKMLPSDAETDRQSREVRGETEKGDLPAMVIAALLTLWPVLLVLGGLLGALYWWVVH